MTNANVQTILMERPAEERIQMKEIPKEKSTLDFLLHQVQWSNVLVIVVWHCLFAYGFFYFFQHPIHVRTLIFGIIISLGGGLGIVIGAHRLWAHRTFKTGLGGRILLMLLNSTSMNGPAYSYARDHRQHHKFSDADGDPKDPRRGLFYSHLGWWMLKKEPIVFEYGKKLDFSDLYDDKVLMFERSYYVPLFFIFGVVLPTAIPVYFFGENVLTAFLACVVFKVTVILHGFFSVNSIAHFFGYRPYDFRIRPTENRLVSYISLAEGNHNYHHVFPYDYRSSPLKSWECMNLGTQVLDLCGALGLAYDFKEATPAAVQEKIEKHGLKGMALFDQKRSLAYRIAYSIVDHICAVIVIGWFAWPHIIYKYFMDLPIVIW